MTLTLTQTTRNQDTGKCIDINTAHESTRVHMYIRIVTCIPHTTTGLAPSSSDLLPISRNTHTLTNTHTNTHVHTCACTRISCCQRVVANSNTCLVCQKTVANGQNLLNNRRVGLSLHPPTARAACWPQVRGVLPPLADRPQSSEAPQFEWQPAASCEPCTRQPLPPSIRRLQHAAARCSRRDAP